MDKPFTNNRDSRRRKRQIAISERGQSLVEYAKVITLISVLAVVTLGVLGLGLSDTYCQIASELDVSGEGEACLADVLPRPSILKAKYDPNKQELDLVAKADKDCEGDLIVREFGEPMIRAGSSYVFKKTIGTDSPPASVHIGNDQCGWTEAVIQ